MGLELICESPQNKVFVQENESTLSNEIQEKHDKEMKNLDLLNQGEKTKTWVNIQLFNKLEDVTNHHHLIVRVMAKNRNKTTIPKFKNFNGW